MTRSWCGHQFSGGVHPNGALTFGLSNQAVWASHSRVAEFPGLASQEPACPGQEAELVWCYVHHILFIKAVKALSDSRGWGSDKITLQKSMWVVDPIIKSSLENTIYPDHCGKSSPVWHSVSLMSPLCPSFDSPFSFPCMPPWPEWEHPLPFPELPLFCCHICIREENWQHFFTVLHLGPPQLPLTRFASMTSWCSLRSVQEASVKSPPLGICWKGGAWCGRKHCYQRFLGKLWPLPDMSSEIMVEYSSVMSELCERALPSPNKMWLDISISLTSNPHPCMQSCVYLGWILGDVCTVPLASQIGLYPHLLGPGQGLE